MFESGRDAALTESQRWLLTLIRWCSLCRWFAELVKEVGSQLVFALLELLLRHAVVVEDRDVQTVLLRLEQM